MKTTVRFFFLVGLMVFIPGLSSFSQVSINTTGDPPVSSAMLDIKSTTGGLLIPRMTQGEMTSISNPANGLQVFCTTDNKLYIFISSINRWKEIELGPGELQPQAIYSLGTGGTNTIVHGNYWAGISLTSSEFVTVQVEVSAIGTYSITTNAVNGYSFSASGEFSTSGPQTINLVGTGTPVTTQTDQFTVTASNNGGTCTFDGYVWASCSGLPTVIYGGQTYHTIQIGTQCWLKENLNIGTRIAGGASQRNNSIIEKYCFNNIEDSCTVYGGLYQWPEMMQFVTTEGTQGICPTGFHLPTLAEWDVLKIYLGGEAVAGGKMKETGTRFWMSPNAGATNSSGFSDRGAGTFRYIYNYFYLIREVGIFWTSSANGSSAWRMNTDYIGATLSPYSCYQQESFPVRCIKD